MTDRKMKEAMAQAELFLKRASAADAIRDAGLETPADIARWDDLAYGDDPKWNLLDVYRPRAAAGNLPVIVNVHGGGYVYGDKDLYQFYCMMLAQNGFAVVNYSYHLAPEYQYPTPIREGVQVLRWMYQHAAAYKFDLNNVFFVGDSAGAQQASQLALLWADPSYAALMELPMPSFRLAAICLNCGMYDLLDTVKNGGPMMYAYFGPKPLKDGTEALDVTGRIDRRYPPVYLMSAANDFLKPNWKPMFELLQARGIPVEGRIYGEPSDKKAGHVFHCDIRSPLAQACNQDEIAFMKKYIR